jgi:hypothetical protein
MRCFALRMLVRVSLSVFAQSRLNVGRFMIVCPELGGFGCFQGRHVLHSTQVMV